MDECQECRVGEREVKIAIDRVSKPHRVVLRDDIVDWLEEHTNGAWGYSRICDTHDMHVLRFYRIGYDEAGKYHPIGIDVRQYAPLNVEIAFKLRFG